ncbi:MAG: TIGR04168 family protein [Leptolyngbyaceae cyanobacterium bins.59]|nr:TIGR04168 family protein [Leptolyngbyaceae cyanobacterium bins.59]
MSRLTNQSQKIRIAVVGDVHDLWEEEDEIALNHLGVDLVLLVGDFGNESIEVVRRVAEMALPKAVILGNHDAWYTASDWGRKQCPYDRRKEDRVQQQLDLLGTTHVGYDKLEFPDWKLTVVGGRPFSWGGPVWKNEEFYRQRFGVSSFAESTDRIVTAMTQATSETLILMGHCGPTGLGDQAEDPCGRDWNPIGGDFGDPDLAAAIDQARGMGKQIPLVVFGHMHHHLRHTKTCLRTPIVVDAHNTVYLNSASVPRILRREEGDLRNFSIVTLQEQAVVQASLIWVDQEFQVTSEQILFDSQDSLV